MRIFLTGASGYVGSAIAAALLQSGNQVTGLVRHPEKVAGLQGRGLQLIQGDLTNAPLLTEQATAHDAIIHAGMAEGAQGSQLDPKAVEALLAGASAGDGKRVFLYTSGIWILGATGSRSVDETAPVQPAPIVTWRPAVERKVLEASGPRLRTHVIRPGIVYGGNSGILAMWWGSALKDKKLRVVGDGHNHWPMVHREDLARLYQLVLERGAPGAVYHGTDDTTHAVMELARAAARAAGVSTPVETWPVDQARAQLGPFADALTLDQRILSPASRKLGWQLQHRDFLEEAGRAFDAFTAASKA